MSSNLVYQKIRENPLYHSLVLGRSRLAFTLSAVVLGLYFLFIGAFACRTRPQRSGNCI